MPYTIHAPKTPFHRQHYDGKLDLVSVVELTTSGWTCLACSKTYSSKSTANRHYKIIHDNKPVTCPICERKLLSELYLTVHMKNVHHRDAVGSGGKIAL
jgi:uncharacterized CHY-type Zn-finger protein